MKKIILSILLVSLTQFDNQIVVQAQPPQKQNGKQGKRPPRDGDMKRPPPGWEPPSDIPPPPPGWKPGDPIPPPPEGWTPPNGDNAPSSGKRGREGGAKNPLAKGGKDSPGKNTKAGKKQQAKEQAARGKDSPRQKNEAPKISKWKPVQFERETGDIIDIKDSKTMHEQIADLGSHKIREPFFMFFMNQTCDECKKSATELAKLGKLMGDKPKLARADCSFDTEACDLFVNHIDASKGKYPFMVMATPQKTHIYEGPINAQQIYDDFVSGEKYLKSPVHGGKGMTTTDIIDAGMKYISQQQLEREKLKRLNDPYWIDEAFAYLFAGTISTIFFHAGYDYWRKETKILIFTAGVLIPLAVVIYQGVMSYIDKEKNERKIVKAVKKIKSY